MPHVHGISSFSMLVLVVLLGALLHPWRAAVLLPMALTLRRRCSPVHPTKVRRPPQSGALVPDTAGPSPPEHRVMGHIWPHRPPRAITRRTVRRQSDGRDSPSPEKRAPQLTHTDPSRTVYPPQPGAPAEPERNHRAQAEPAAEPERNRTASRQGPESAAAAEAAEQGNTERPAGTSGDSAANDGPPRTPHRTGRP